MREGGGRETERMERPGKIEKRAGQRVKKRPLCLSTPPRLETTPKREEGAWHFERPPRPRLVAFLERSASESESVSRAGQWDLASPPLPLVFVHVLCVALFKETRKPS